MSVWSPSCQKLDLFVVVTMMVLTPLLALVALVVAQGHLMKDQMLLDSTINKGPHNDLFR